MFGSIHLSFETRGLLTANGQTNRQVETMLGEKRTQNKTVCLLHT